MPLVGHWLDSDLDASIGPRLGSIVGLTPYEGWQAVYVITSLTSGQASPQRLALIVRGHWGIENRINYVRDVTFGEDACKIHTGHGPENMATLRNLATGCLRIAGYANIAAARREMSYDTFNAPLDLLGIPTRPAPTSAINDFEMAVCAAAAPSW